MELAAVLDRRSGLAGRILPVLVEVHTSGEETKRGVPLIRGTHLPNHAIRGLMTMPHGFDDPEQTRPYIRVLRELRNAVIREGIPGVEMRELSMGMSDDFEVAIQEGATIVCIGRSIFGERPPNAPAGVSGDGTT
jgi:uncharacterized pyridoxal phosphate-containing UPF0001 family protein